MRRGLRLAAWIAGLVVAGVAIVAVVVVLLLTQTDFGRRKVLSFALPRLQGLVHGHLSVGSLHGNLVSSVRLDRVVITDSAGRPFLDVDTLGFQYSLPALLTRHLDLDHIRLAGVTIVLDQPPGGEWNFRRIFPSQPPPPGAKPGFGSWVALRNAVVRHGTIVVRSAWAPADTLHGGARQQAIDRAVSNADRSWIVAVPGGYQQIQVYADVDARLPRMRLAEPGTENQLVDIGSLSARAFPLLPPPADVRDLRARVVLTPDSVLFDSLLVRLPGSAARGGGAYALDGSRTRLRLDADSLALHDLRFVYPAVPAGGGHLRLAYAQDQDRTRIAVSNVDLRAAGAILTGHAALTMGHGPLRPGPTDLAFAELSTDLIRRYAPAFPAGIAGSLAGEVHLQGVPDSLELAGWLRFRQRGGAESRLQARGTVASTAGGAVARPLRLTLEPLRLSLLEPVLHGMAAGGVVRGSATLRGSTGSGFDLDADLVQQAPATGRSQLRARGYLRTAGGLAARDLTIDLRPLQIALVKPFVPRTIPFGGVVRGTATVTGSLRSGFDLAADLVQDAPATGLSHVTARGRVQLSGGLATRDLRLGFQPLQLAALAPFAPSLSIGGTLSGHADVTASLAAQRVSATLDVRHDGPTGASRLVGHAIAGWRSPGSFDIDLRAPTLSLATVGAFVPAAGLRGRGSGDIVARGSLAHLVTDVNLAVAGGGAFDLHGTLGLAGRPWIYDFTSSFTAFDAGAISGRAPHTSLSGTVTARGSGLRPDSATGSLDADLVDSRAAGSPGLDTVRVRARLADGLATVEQGHVRLGSALADVSGSFGLAADRSGALRYNLSVDSIAQLARQLPADTGVVARRPLVTARRLTRARLDSALEARATRVQRLAVGYPAPPVLRPDTAALPRDSLAGSLATRGVVSGNIDRFDLRGSARARRLTAAGQYLGAAAASYALLGYGTPEPLVRLDAVADSVELNGFAFDSVRAGVEYHGLTRNGNGTADIGLVQDSLHDYRLRSSFDLAPGRSQLGVQDMRLRFDTTVWHTLQPATFRWGGGSLAVDDFDLRNGEGGRLRLNGRLPASGSGDLTLDVQQLPVGELVALVQDTATVRGTFDANLRIQGSTHEPAIAGHASLAQGEYGGARLPGVQATLDYGGERLHANARLYRDTALVAYADAQLPMNLAFAGVHGPRLLRTGPLRVDLQVDSLPLNSLPELGSVVTQPQGVLQGRVAVRGTFDRPRLDGQVELQRGSMRIIPSGVLYSDISGVILLRGDSAVIDSLVAHSGGTIRLSGTVGLASLTRPTFDLTLASANAALLNNEYGDLRADARLSASGPYDALRVTGTTTVTGGIIYAPEISAQHATNLDDPQLSHAIGATELGPAVLPPPNPLLQNLRVNVALRVSPDTWVRNSQINVEIYTPPGGEPLRLRMNNARQTLGLLGSINTDRGEYTYAGRVFRVSTGSATFLGSGDIDPLLQGTAVYEVQRQGRQNLAIQINVSGTLTAPRVTLQSNGQPPLSQSDLLSYLAFGQPASSLLSQQGSSGLGSGGSGGLNGVPGLVEQQVASLALGALVDQGVRNVEAQGTRAGLDVFRVHPGDLPAEAAFQGYFQNFLRGTEYEAGKYINPRLFLELRGRASTWPGVSVEYREGSGFTWTTSWAPHYLPQEPTLATVLTAAQARVFSTFLRWSHRF